MAQPSIAVGEQLRDVLRGLNREGFTDAAIAARGGPKPASMTNLRGSKPISVRRGTLRALDKGFGWEPGTAEQLARGEHPGLVWQPDAELLSQLSSEGLVNYGPFWARPSTPEEDALHRSIAATVVSAIRKPSPTAEGAVGEGLTAVQQGAVRDYIEAQRAVLAAQLEALERLAQAFADED